MLRESNAIADAAIGELRRCHSIFPGGVPSEIGIGGSLPQLCDERQDNSAEGFGDYCHRNRGRRNRLPREIISQNGGGMDRDNSPYDEGLIRQDH